MCQILPLTTVVRLFYDCSKLRKLYLDSTMTASITSQFRELDSKSDVSRSSQRRGSGGGLSRPLVLSSINSPIAPMRVASNTLFVLLVSRQKWKQYVLHNMI